MVIENYESKGVYFDWPCDFGNEVGRSSKGDKKVLFMGLLWYRAGS